MRDRAFISGVVMIFCIINTRQNTAGDSILGMCEQGKNMEKLSGGGTNEKGFWVLNIEYQ